MLRLRHDDLSRCALWGYEFSKVLCLGPWRRDTRLPRRRPAYDGVSKQAKVTCDLLGWSARTVAVQAVKQQCEQCIRAALTKLSAMDLQDLTDTALPISGQEACQHNSMWPTPGGAIEACSAHAVLLLAETLRCVCRLMAETTEDAAGYLLRRSFSVTMPERGRSYCYVSCWSAPKLKTSKGPQGPAAHFEPSRLTRVWAFAKPAKANLPGWLLPVSIFKLPTLPPRLSAFPVQVLLSSPGSAARDASKIEPCTTSSGLLSWCVSRNLWKLFFAARLHI